MKSKRRGRKVEIELSGVHCDHVAERARLEALALEGLRSGPPRRFDERFLEELRRRIHAAGRRMQARDSAPAKRVQRRS